MAPEPSAPKQEVVTSPSTVGVVLLQPLRNPMGGSWAANERAGFPPEVARDLIRRGIARPDQDKMIKKDATQTK